MIKLVFFLLFFFISDQSFSQTVRIASWNINTLSEKSGQALMKNSVIREENDYAVLRKYVKEINADIVALQEMGSYGAVKKLFPKDTWDIFFAEDNNLSIHTAITVRKNTVKILKHDFHNTINDFIYMEKKPRQAIEILFEVNGQKATLLNVHLKSFCFLGSITSPKTSHCTILSMQTDWLKSWIDQKKSSNIPFIIAGDFNRKLNHFGENDEFWKKIDQHNSLIRLPSQKTSRCHMTKNKNQEPIDFFIMNAEAQKLLAKGSFSEILYHKKEAMEYGYRLSDHCPIAVNYNF